MKKSLTALLCAVLMLTLLPQAVKAAEDYLYVDENGDTQTTAGLTVTPITAETATLTSGWYVVDSDVTRASTITVNGDVTLLLMDGFTLTVTGSGDNAGINVSPGNSLTVYGQAAGAGALLAQGGGYGAGIGGEKFGSGGTITINSGTVTATGGYSAAGIGGGHYRPNGNVIIKGGTVTALGGSCGAGIGGGNYGSGGTIAISGGTVTATGGQNSAGIGGGEGASGSNNSNGGTITISGGTVTANGKGDGAGIGGGMFGTGGTIKILGGDVKGTSSGGAGIGGGAVKDGGSITISGGKVEASGYDGAGIGGGALGSGGNIIISGGEVTASGTYRSAGIGGGIMGSGGTTTIENGTVIANGGDQGGAGIGGGDLASANDIKILNGDVTARGGVWGAGIGGGGAGLYAGQPRGSGGNITISGGTIRAYGGDYAAGIGAGGTNTANPHNGGTIQILGGKVTARGGGSGMDAGLDIGRGRNGINGTVLLDGTARVELVSNRIDTSVTTIGTCIIRGAASGALLGAYEDGTKLEGTLIDLSSPTLASGTGYTVSGNSITLTGANPCILSDGTTARNVIVSAGASADVVLFAADIAPVSGCAFDMTGATVNLKLVGANSLKSAGVFAGLQVPDGAALQVTGSGSLTAEGGSNGAGIGGRSGLGAGGITISGGDVTALGNGGGAGIGGGNGGAGGIVLAEGADTVVSVTGGINGYDIGSGNGSGAGGSLTVNNDATVVLNRNGTNAAASYITCMVGGEGAGLKAGTYMNSYKFLTYGDVGISPGSDAKALDTVTLSVVVEGLSDIDPEGTIAFMANGTEIGRSPITRADAGSVRGTVAFDWIAPGGAYTLTAQYVQNEILDSYTATGSVQIATGYTVLRIEQAPLTISDPGVTYTDAPFDLSVGGGSGTGDMSFSVTSGDAVSVNASGRVTINKAGTATIAVVKAADSNYEKAEATVTITVRKATPASVVFPTASAITYGATLSSSVLSCGSGDGTFAWVNPDTVPTVNNSGYNVVFTPRDADNYDYSGFTLEDIVGILVGKALPVVTFPTASNITYGESLSSSTLSGGSGDGSFAWKNPDTVPHVINSGYTVVFTPSDAENYQTVEQIVGISVDKADQAPLSVHIPGEIRNGYADFNLEVSGGSGTGALSYAVISGDSVAVDASGRVRVLNLGISVLTVTKAGDDLYNETSVSVEIRVKANATSGAAATPIPTPSPSAGALPTPPSNVVFTPSVSATPALVIDVLPATPASAAPSGASSAPLTDATPGPYEEAAVLAPINMEEDSETGRIMVEVSITDLPEDTTAIRLASGKVIYIDHTQETLQLEIGRDDLNAQGELEILALHEQIPLALYKIVVVSTHGQVSAADSKTHVLIWIAGGIVLAGLAGAIIVIRRKKYKQRV